MGLGGGSRGEKKKNTYRPAERGAIPVVCVWIERGLRDVRSCVCKHFFLTLLILLLFLEPLVNEL